MKYVHKIQNSFLTLYSNIIYLYIFLLLFKSWWETMGKKDIVFVPLSWGTSFPESEAPLPMAPLFLLPLYTALAEAPWEWKKYHSETCNNWDYTIDVFKFID